MNTPNYISQNNNQTSILLRPMYERMGFAARHFPEWIDLRIKNLSLVEGKDFRTYTADRHVQYEAPLAVALSILATVPVAKAEPVKKELSHVQTTDNQSGQFEAQNEPVATPNPLIGSLFGTTPTSATTIKLTGPLPVMQIEGRAAVNAKDLFLLWNSIEARSLAAWMNYRIESRGLIVGKHYAEYDVPAQPGHRRGTTGYILSIDAAILIADSEPKGKGKPVAAYLINFRKDLAKQKLPNKAKLSDFIGLPPSNVITVEPEPVSPISENPAAEPISQQALFTENTVSGELQASEGVNERLDGNSEEADSLETVENHNGAIEGISPTFGENSESNSGNDGDPVITDEDQSEPLTIEDQAQPIFDFMVQMAQGLLKQAQALADHQKAMKAMQSTLWMLVSIEQQTALQKLGLHKGTVSMPTQTMRDKIKAAVHKRATATGEKHEDIFKLIYKRLHYDYGWNVSALPREKGETHLGLCERCGILEYVWAVVDSRAFNAYANPAPAQ